VAFPPLPRLASRDALLLDYLECSNVSRIYKLAKQLSGAMYWSTNQPELTEKKIAMAAKAFKTNIAVYTNPQHDLWIGEATPTLQSVQNAEDLKEGQVTVAIRSTGICG